MSRLRKLRKSKTEAEEYESVLFPREEDNNSDDSSNEEIEDIVLNTRRVTQDEHSEEEEEAGLVEDDDVPEAMSFSSGRETALHQMKTALQQIGRNKEKMKEKRRQINEQNKLQKQKKLEALAKKKLSADFFDDLPDVIPNSNNLKRKAVHTNDSQPARDSEDEESFADTEEDQDVNDDFIPLEERLGGVSVEKVKETKKKVLTSVEQALQFKQQKLYGGKIPRMTSDSLFALKGKRKYCFTQTVMDATKEDDAELDTLRQELDWLLRDQVHKVLEEINSILWECSRRFPTRPGYDESKCMVTPQRLLLTCANGTNGSVKCVVTLEGDRISGGDISFKHKQGKDNHSYKTTINPEVSWKLQQIQDATNFLYSAMNTIEEQEERDRYTSAKQVILLLDKVIDSLNQGRSALAFPKRKSLEELLYNRNMVECSVQWLNEAVMLFTLALQRCQQLKDKVREWLMNIVHRSQAGDESDYEAAVHGCTLADDVEISRADSGDLDPEQSYWISGKQLELGCQPRGSCTRLVVGQIRRSGKQSLDYICMDPLSSRRLTRMAVQCADGYDVANITTYEDINYLYNRSVFPINRTMVIRNFYRPGYQTRCRTATRGDTGVTFTYRDCHSSLPSLCITGASGSLTTLTIIEYDNIKTRIKARIPDQRTEVFQVLSTMGPIVTLFDNATRTDDDKLQRDIQQNNDAGLFSLGPVHLLSIGFALVLTFIVLLIIIIVLIKRNRRQKVLGTPPSIKDNENEYASWFSSKEQLTEGSKGSNEGEGCHYMTIPADRDYQSLELFDQTPANLSHVYTSVTSSGQARVFGKKHSVSYQK
ncbi:uncharacterized protein LOC125664807 [Ostrea edulis]|uniref:uncharacterized protein LOC125664807 n=1 Tax=Ostrea edulis TaxID=37623 RepID=UPI0024AEA383|nr:uncharacterized protein LOC125664807 [Ostrea edulis]